MFSMVSEVYSALSFLLQSPPPTDKTCAKKGNKYCTKKEYLKKKVTFPWTAESGWWFPERQPVFAPPLCSCRCSHSERTLLSAAHPPSLRWPGPEPAPPALSAGHQLRQRAQMQSEEDARLLKKKPAVLWFHSQVTSPIATVQFQPDVPLPTILEWSLCELLQSIRMIQQNLEEIQSLWQGCTTLHLQPHTVTCMVLGLLWPEHRQCRNYT